MLVRIFYLSSFFLLFSCLPNARLMPMSEYETEVNLPFAEAWEILLNHISSDYIVQNIDLENGIIQADFKSEVPKALLDCGQLINHGTQQNNTGFSYTFKAEESPLHTIISSKESHFYNTRILELHGKVEVRLLKSLSNSSKVQIKILYALHKFDNYRELINGKNVSEKKYMQHKVAYFNQGEVGTFPPERFEPNKEFSVEQFLSENANSAIDATRFSNLDDANIFYAPPKILLNDYPERSTSMYCVPNTRIEESIIHALNAPQN